MRPIGPAGRAQASALRSSGGALDSTPATFPSAAATDWPRGAICAWTSSTRCHRTDGPQSRAGTTRVAADGHAVASGPLIDRRAPPDH
jgi:hypothetical protein